MSLTVLAITLPIVLPLLVLVVIRIRNQVRDYRRREAERLHNKFLRH